MAILDRIKKGNFVISVQLDPPRKNLSEFADMVRTLKKAGVWLVDINSSRIINTKPIPHDSIYSAIISAKLGMEVIPHITTRDMAIGALASQIRSSYEGWGIRNFLVITGDPYEAAQSLIKFKGQKAKGIFQTDSVGAIDIFHNQLRLHPKITCDIKFAAAINQNAENIKDETERISKKLNAGADFFMSQPVFSLDQASRLFTLHSSAVRKTPLMVGLWPLFDKRTVEKIVKGLIPGVFLPNDVYCEVTRYWDSENVLREKESERLLQLLAFIKSSGVAHGVYIVAPLRNPLLLLNLLPSILSR